MKIIYSDKFLDKVSWFMKVGGITLFPFIILREIYKTSIDKDEVINHESIHIKQQIELLVIFFYILYGIFYLFNLINHKNKTDAYMNIPFEKEAYQNEKDMGYLKNRKLYSWLKT